jgi:hypothetical protein
MTSISDVYNTDSAVNKQSVMREGSHPEGTVAHLIMVTRRYAFHSIQRRTPFFSRFHSGGDDERRTTRMMADNLLIPERVPVDDRLVEDCRDDQICNDEHGQETYTSKPEFDKQRRLDQRRKRRLAEFLSM